MKFISRAKKFLTYPVFGIRLRFRMINIAEDIKKTAVIIMR